MQKIKSYKMWSRLSDKERELEYLQWDAYASEGQDILKESIKELRNQHRTDKSVLEITGGLYHGGLLVININLKKGAKIRLPRKYKGFPAMKSYKKINTI